ncbi:molybdenum cofactor biosynthesis protein MoaE [Demequina activiva]|uniref:Molybdenum cofactor biosynthesis protein MoaE n=1 Tax=Demequina activiva TaxID=1582364 RepID=A0A919Q2I1_9MICO|nr:molybdenum cofactor biosynthesis protein MoaE [Demequina activiva]GIG55042.1 molybdenum cofactor biosynthesis protein MoaE [Demequina activiva]
MAVAIARIDAQPLSADAHIDAVTSARDGAVATFIGQVRDHDPSVEGAVTHLEYSAHPDAEATLARIAAEVAEGDVTVAVTHRIGLLSVGDAAIIAAAAAPHRAEAFEACRAVVERVKAEVPIWKREVLADGSHTWVGVS